MKEILIEIPGDPVAWKAHGGSGKTSFNPRWKERKRYEAIIAHQYRGSIILDAVYVDYLFYVRVPTSFSAKKREKCLLGQIYPLRRPDRDNYAKFLSDCLQKTVILDDAQIVDGRISKRYALIPHTIIRISLASHQSY